jgi:hypothetical protein
MISDFLCGENEYFFTLFYIWEYFKKGREHNEFTDSTNGEIQNENRHVTPNGNDLDVSTVTHYCAEGMATDNGVNFGK